MRIILDTHAVLFAAFGRLSQKRSALIQDSNNELFISQISAWEISKLVQYGKIKLNDGLEGFLEKLYSHPRYSLVGLEPAILAKSVQIADSMHKDPADQLIVATALTLKGSLMTSDKNIRRLKIVECL